MTVTDTAGGSDKIVIDAWLHYYKTPRFLDCTRDAIDGFQLRHPDYEIRLHERDYTVMPLEITKAVERGERPAMGQYYSTSTQAAFDVVHNDGSPLYMSAEEAIGGRDEILGEPVVDDVNAHVQRYFRDTFGRTATPPLGSTTLMYANVSLLEKAGVERIPETWQELEAACRAVTALSGGPSHGITFVNHGWMFMQAMAMQGALLVDHDNGRSGRAESPHFDSPGMMNFVDWWTGLQHDGLYLYTGTRKDWPACFGAFAEQEAAFIWTSSVDAPRLVQLGLDRGFTVRAAQLPHNGDVPRAGNVLGGDGIFLAANLPDEVRDGALAFLQYNNNLQSALDRHRHTNYMPITDTAVAHLVEQEWFVKYPDRHVCVEQLDAAADTPASIGAVVGELPRLQEILTHAMHDVLVADVDPVVRFAQAQAEGQRLIDDYNAHTGPGRDHATYIVH
jgi:sn-glycerol 3-phosphate transport system substrate-binding protein